MTPETTRAVAIRELQLDNLHERSIGTVVVCGLLALATGITGVVFLTSARVRPGGRALGACLAGFALLSVAAAGPAARRVARSRFAARLAWLSRSSHATPGVWDEHAFFLTVCWTLSFVLASFALALSAWGMAPDESGGPTRTGRRARVESRPEVRPEDALRYGLALLSVPVIVCGALAVRYGVRHRTFGPARLVLTHGAVAGPEIGGVVEASPRLGRAGEVRVELVARSHARVLGLDVSGVVRVLEAVAPESALRDVRSSVTIPASAITTGESFSAVPFALPLPDGLREHFAGEEFALHVVARVDGRPFRAAFPASWLPLVGDPA